MSAIMSVEEAQANLKKIIHQLAPGQEVVIMENEQPMAKLIAPAGGTASPCARAGEGHTHSPFRG
jgi:antitoxin (DNA-binding transcriptional repressor) of toxin-antitoxin stability system